MALSASAGPIEQKKCDKLNLKRVIEKCAQVGLPLLLCGQTPTAEAQGSWVAGGATLDCSQWAYMPSTSTEGGVVCKQFGTDPSHGVTCIAAGYAYAINGYANTICSQIVIPDNLVTRGCSMWSEEFVAGYAGMVCDSYGLDVYAPYCTRANLASVGVFANVACGQIYCPTCLRFVPDTSNNNNNQCFPEKSWLKVKAADGAIQLKAMRDIRIGDWVHVSQSPDGSEVYSPIVDIPHRQPGKKGNYLNVSAHGISFLISPEHLVYLASDSDEKFDQKSAKTKFARDLAPGDLLWTHNHTTVAIEESPEPTKERGMYAPESETGTLIVYGSPDESQGALVSCYASFVDPSVTQALFRARRWIYPPQPIEENTVRQAGPWEEQWLNSIQLMLPSGFVGHEGPQEIQGPSERPSLRSEAH